jgi:hypothetical protein
MPYEFRLTGGTTNGNPFLSLGGLMSNTKITDGKISNLWDDVSQIQYTEGVTEYRWFVFYNNGSDVLKTPHFYFLPKDDYVDIEFSKLPLGIPPTLLSNEETRPSEEEIGPEIDFPMPFEKSTEDWATTQSVYNNIPAQGKLYICARRLIPPDALGDQPSGENRGYILVVGEG